MKKIIDILTKEEVNFSKEDLPILVHGREHSGASLLSITIAAHLHEAGEKLCIFTAYPMAKDEFLKQVENPGTVLYVENENDLARVSSFQTVIIQSGNVDLFVKIISDVDKIKDRVVFVKNIETINTPILERIRLYPYMVSGDFLLNPQQKDFIELPYKIKIFFTKLREEKLPELQKYQAFCKKTNAERIIAVD